MQSWPMEIWLSRKTIDPNELENLAASQPDRLREMQLILKQELQRIKVPAEQMQRLGIEKI